MPHDAEASEFCRYAVGLVDGSVRGFRHDIVLVAGDMSRDHQFLPPRLSFVGSSKLAGQRGFHGCGPSV
ncbi:MAG: hypothetical protein ACOH2F_09120, partial [Cellulomonas sp.]